MNLLEETRYILKKHGICANKNLGQNFLINEEVIDKIIESANLSKEDLVIEIGPGLGTLTAKLLEKAGKVIAVELDNRMIKILTERFQLYQNFELINDDILKVDLNAIIKSNVDVGISNEIEKVGSDALAVPQKVYAKQLKHVKIVANLPYYITTPIIMKLLEEKLKVDSITVMVQKEVADRLTAIPGEKVAGTITYSVYYYAEAKNIVKVTKDSFIPAPNVDSEVIQLLIRKKPPVNVKDEKLMFRIIKQAFMQRRKTLVNALEKSGLFQNKEEIINLLKQLNIDEKIRGEALTIEEFAKISDDVMKDKL